MTMLFDPAPRSLLAAHRHHLRAAPEAVGRLCHAFAVNLMRRQMRRALHSLSDRLLAQAGVKRSEIDAMVVEHIPHRAPAPPSR